MEEVIIIVPVYKAEITKEEKMSFRQCCKVLQQHTICLVTHAQLNCDMYNNIAMEYDVRLKRENFDEEYFKTVYGYNQLMLSKFFYQRFLQYEYMLVYQLDAYIFRDDLLYWCEKGYDFIGAPLLEDKYGWDNRYLIPNSNNGGFSLRKVRYCLKFLSYKGPILKFKTIYAIQKQDQKRKAIENLVLSIVRAFGYHNTIDYFINHTYYNEDLLFCLTFDVGESWINIPIHQYETYIKPNLPSIAESASFALERHPKYFVEMFGSLPMGCHAWQNNEEFWREYMDNTNIKDNG